MLSPWDLEACKGLGLCGPVWASAIKEISMGV